MENKNEYGMIRYMRWLYALVFCKKFTMTLNTEAFRLGDITHNILSPDIEFCIIWRYRGTRIRMRSHPKYGTYSTLIVKYKVAIL